MSKLFLTNGNNAVHTSLSAVTAAMTDISRLAGLQAGGTMVSAAHAGKMLSMESFGAGESESFSRRIEEVEKDLASVVDVFHRGDSVDPKTYASVTRCSLEAARIGAVLAANPQAAFAASSFDNVTSHNNIEVLRVGAKHGDFYTSRNLDLQAFDNTPTRQITEWTTTYSLGAVRQNAFAQAFWLPIAVSPEEPGLLATIRARYVQDDIKRSIKGTPQNWNRKPLIHALVDDSILRDDQTDVIPVYRDTGANANTEYFVDAAIVPPTIRKYDGQDVVTSYLKFGADVALIDISQIDSLIAAGVMNQFDALDTAIQVLSLVVKVGDDVLELNVEHFTGSNFAYSVQGNVRSMSTNLLVEGLLLNENTRNLDGSALTTLKPVVDGQYQVRLGLKAFGEFNLETSRGSMESPINGLRATRITHPSAPTEELSMTGGNGKIIADLLAGATMLGYKLAARRVNTDRRNRGQLIDTMEWRKYYAIPLRAPITAVRPVSAADQGDAELIQTLLETTYVRASNDAVAALFRAFGALKSTCATGTPVDINPEFMGMASKLVTPFAEEYDLDCQLIVDSLTSSGRTVDIQAALINVMRDKAFQIAVQTNYFVALSSYYGGQNIKPTVLLGTDQRLAAYLNIVGDNRLMGPEMSHHVVASPNRKMRDTIFMTFADYNEGSQGKYNPMHFGHFAIKPEVVTNTQVSRGQQTIREMTVMPSYIHIPNLPILVKFNVKNLDAVLAKNPILFKQV